MIDTLGERSGSTRLEVGGSDLRVSFSAGIASSESGHATATDLLAAPDRALHAAMTAGRNRIMRGDPVR